MSCHLILLRIFMAWKDENTLSLHPWRYLRLDSTSQSKWRNPNHPKNMNQQVEKKMKKFSSRSLNPSSTTCNFCSPLSLCNSWKLSFLLPLSVLSSTPKLPLQSPSILPLFSSEQNPSVVASKSRFLNRFQCPKLGSPIYSMGSRLSPSPWRSISARLCQAGRH